MAAWSTDAVARLDELERIHADARGSGPGRRWGTEQLNRSMFVALVAQFQTYSRDLHDEAIDVHVTQANPQQAGVLRVLLTQGRLLDKGNPRSSALGSDFGRLGFQLVPAVRAQGAGVSAALDELDVLVDFRNAVSHGNDSQLAAIVASGVIKPTLPSYRRFRKLVQGLVGTLDQVVATQLSAVLAVAPPW
jgi:hypothetical protein